MFNKFAAGGISLTREDRMNSIIPPQPPLLADPQTPRITERPGIVPVQLGVVHAMGEYVIVDGEPIHALDWLTKDFPDIEEVWSADAVIDPGGTVYLLNPDIAGSYSWHAGRSAWLDLPKYRNGLNHLSVGVEVLVEGQHSLTSLKETIKRPEAYRPVQYRSLGWLFGVHWWNAFKIPLEKIRGHEEISGPAVRPDPKPDPGEGFDWAAFRQKFQEYHEAYC
jgi:hypothetical protein